MDHLGPTEERRGAIMTLTDRPARLYRTAVGEMRAEEAVASLESGTMIGWSATEVLVGRIVAGRAHGPDGEVLDLTGVFELRAFDGAREARWRNRAGGAGSCVILAEEPPVPGCAPEPDVQVAIDGVGQLVWGTGTGRTVGDGWSELAEARIGTLRVPIGGVENGQRVRIEQVEYVRRGKHGNAEVIDDRLVGFALVEPTG